MTKAELINKFSNSKGISDADSKLFFELLLKRFSKKLKPGQSLFISDLGYFHLIKGKIKLPSAEIDSEELGEEKIDIILYSEEQKLSESNAKGFVFNVPFSDEEDYNSIDSHFSLSIGKPLIPLLGVLDQRTYIPKSSSDQRRYLESKIDEIMSDSKIIHSEEEFPTLIIDASSYNSDQVQLEKPGDELEALLSDEQTINADEETKETKPAKNIAWDFGEYYTKKISAESVFQLAHQILSNPSVEKQNLPDDVKELEIQNQEDDDILDKLLEHETESNDSKENIEESNIEVADEPEIINNQTELVITDKVEEETEAIEEPPLKISEESLKEDLSDEEFWKSTSKLFETYNPRELGSEHNQEFSELISDGLNDNEPEKETPKIELAPQTQESDDSVDEENVENEEVKQEPDITSDKKSSKRWVLFLIPIILILAFAAYYFYLQINNKNQSKPEQKVLSLKSDNTNVIQRDFEIPVTYPYPAKNEISKESNRENKIPADVEKKNNNQNTSTVNNKETKITEKKTKSSLKNIVPAGIPISLGKNIYRYGNVYVVQVAAFRSNSIAENEAGRYRNKGYNSFVEQVEIPGRGLWYRIRVGNFSSLEEANNFISKKNR